MKHVTIRQALQNVADNPVSDATDLLQVKVHELVCRNLFDIANQPTGGERGSLARANRARKLIMNRLVGHRRAGSHPATSVEVSIEFHDLTGGAIEA